MRARLWLTVAVGLAACGPRAPAERIATGFPLNGGFEQGLEAWGTGYIEDSVRKYHAPEEGDLPYWVSPSRQATLSRLALDREVLHGGTTAARIDHTTAQQAQHYGTLAQRVPVTPNATYEVRLWTRAEPGPGASWFLTTTREWEPHLNLPVTPAWAESTWRFTTEAQQSTVELRVVVQGPGRYWIDDVALVELR